MIVRVLIAAAMLTPQMSAFGQALPMNSAASEPRRVSLIPQPAKLDLRDGSFELKPSTRILRDAASPECRTIAEFIAEVVKTDTGLKLHIADLAQPRTEGEPDAIVIRTPVPEKDGDPEAYGLAVTPQFIQLAAVAPAGLSRGSQTLRQLLPLKADSAGQWRVPCVSITDRPQYRWRGMLLDCGRHFMPKEFVKRYIDLLAYHKLNVLHWHVTEDQGWRIEIKKHPKLTEIGAWRKATRDGEQPRDAQGRYGGFYTQDDVREIVAYAAARHVTVVPEIELPGHSLAALAAVPELSCTGGPFEVGTKWGVCEDVYCAGNDATFAFLEDVLTEVAALFPSQYVHIGGDECPKARWKACPKCQARIKSEKLKDERELQSYFIRRIEKFLNSKGKRIIGWDEILEGGLAPNATVQSWRGFDGLIAATRAGHDVIASPTSHCYLDYAQGRGVGEPSFMGFVPLEKVYEFQPWPPELTAEQAAHILGGEGNVWTEHAPPDLVDRQAFPRLCALAEVLWSPPAARRYADFTDRLATHLQRLDALGVRYYVGPPTFEHADVHFRDRVSVKMSPSMPGGKVYFTLDGAEPTAASQCFEQELLVTQSATLKARTILPSGNAGVIAEQRFTRLLPNAAISADGAIPGLSYTLYAGQWGSVPDFDSLTPAGRGVCSRVSSAVGDRETEFGLRFEGLLTVPADGVYTFTLDADDEAVLHLGAEAPLDLSARWETKDVVGKVWLSAGAHALRLDFVQQGGPKRLSLEIEGPGVRRQPLADAMLRHLPPKQ